MNATLFTHIRNSSDAARTNRAAYAAIAPIEGLLKDAGFVIELVYFDADFAKWFSFKKRVLGYGLVIIHIDANIKVSNKIMDLCQQYGMIAVNDSQQLITRQGYKKGEELLKHVQELLAAKA